MPPNPSNDDKNKQMISAAQYRSVMSRFATGVSVVTTKDEKSTSVGLTVNSLTSVSLNPPILLFCLNKKSGSWPAIKGQGGFIVNILSQTQETVSRQMAQPHSTEKWDGIHWHMKATDFGECPLIDGSLGHLSCKIRDTFESGDHYIITADVLEAEINENLSGKAAAPLLYFASGYRHIAPA